ncbi:hypothetical protein HRR80_007862 [Exophiala dermatitidis]|uniref:Uncharacterized protein n=1 Tax=Exophiala dermatitidis TaxID=5970 RepID=A0AAN6EMJ8_EXODE|nr:hypothetical protein HRR80_007862 [Exophiala dermatitidis]
MLCHLDSEKDTWLALKAVKATVSLACVPGSAGSALDDGLVEEHQTPGGDCLIAPVNRRDEFVHKNLDEVDYDTGRLEVASSCRRIVMCMRVTAENICPQVESSAGFKGLLSLTSKGLSRPGV